MRVVGRAPARARRAGDHAGNDLANHLLKRLASCAANNRASSDRTRNTPSRMRCLLVCLTLLSLPAALAAREREPNSVYAARRARLEAQLSAPIVVFGFTGKESSAPSYVFLQEPNFYYLTGDNEEGAAVLLLASSTWK